MLMWFTIDFVIKLIAKLINTNKNILKKDIRLIGMVTLIHFYQKVKYNFYQFIAVVKKLYHFIG